MIAGRARFMERQGAFLGRLIHIATTGGFHPIHAHPGP